MIVFFCPSHSFILSLTLSVIGSYLGLVCGGGGGGGVYLVAGGGNVGLDCGWVVGGKLACWGVVVEKEGGIGLEVVEVVLVLSIGLVRGGG